MPSFRTLVAKIREVPVSVGIVTKDRPDYLREAIKSIQQQTTRPKEVIICDDASRQDLSPLIEEFPDLPITFIRSDTPLGRPKARNAVVENFTSDYLLWLDDDDALLPTAIESHLETLQEIPEAGIVYGNLVVCNENLSPVYALKKAPLTSNKLLETFVSTNPIPNPGTIISRKTFDQVGLYDDFYQRGQDYHFFARAAEKKILFVHNNDYVCFYRSHEAGTASKRNYQKHLQYRSAVVKQLLKNNPLEKIFTDFPWQADQAMAQLCASQQLSVTFVRAKDYEAAKNSLKQVDAPQYKVLVDALCALIDELDSGDIFKLADNRVFYTEMAEQLIVARYESWDEPEVCDAVMRRYYSERDKRLPAEQVYPGLNWQADPQGAAREAEHLIAANYLERGDSEKADKLFREKNLSTDNLYTLNPKAYSPDTQTLIAALGRRKSRQSEWEKEEGLHLSEESEELEIERPQPDKSGVLEKSLPLLTETAAIRTGQEPRLEGDLKRERDHERIIWQEGNAEISVVIPTYKREKTLREAISSILAQGVPGIEIIVVDDAGNELPLDFLREHQIKTVSHKTNCGLAASRNTGASVASGQWLMFLDDDDLLVSNSVAKLRQQLNAEVVVGEHIRLHHNDDNQMTEVVHHRLERLDLSIENSHMPTGSFLMNKILFDRLGGYREDMPVQEDYNLHLRALRYGKVTGIQEPIFYYRVNVETGSLNNDKRFFWFATSALNHELCLKLFGEKEGLRHAQTVNQYSHLARGLKEGGVRSTARELIQSWWKIMEDAGLDTTAEKGVLGKTSSPIISGYTWNS